LLLPNLPRFANVTMSASCIYRATKLMGTTCNDATVHDTDFCASHRRHSNTFLFQQLHIMIGDNLRLDAKNVIACLLTYFCSSKASPIDAAFEAVEMLCYLTDHGALRNIAIATQLGDRYQNKQTLASNIVKCAWKVWELSQKPAAVGALIKLQQAWRNKKLKLLGPWPGVPATNEHCPFTMESLGDIPRAQVFSFIDFEGHVYAFSVQELYSAVTLYKQQENPFTKQPIPISALLRLSAWKRMQPSEPEPPTPEPKQWSSPALAYTELAGIFEERFGIYMQPAWFLHFNSYTILNVFQTFHEAVVFPTTFMSREAEVEAYITLDTNKSHYVLVREALHLATSSIVTRQLYQICCLCIALARYSSPFAHSLPDWVYDAVESM
jgi:hypothetical protein